MKIQRKLKIIVILSFVFVFGACTKNEEFEDTNAMKDYIGKDMLHSGVFHNDKIYIPYPLQNYYGEVGVPYAIAELDDDKITFINTDPTNLCNKGNSSECTTFNAGWIESLIITSDYIVSVEASLDAEDFETYLTIRNIDGSNRKEIFKLKEGNDVVSDFNIQSDNVHIYFEFEDDIYKYTIHDQNLINLTDTFTHSGIDNLKLLDGILYFSVDEFEVDGVKYATSIISYQETFEVKASNIEGRITRAFHDKYFVLKEYGEQANQYFELYVNDYEGESTLIPLEDPILPYLVATNDYVVLSYSVFEDGRLENYLRLYESQNKKLIELDEIMIDETGWLLLWGIDKNKILMGASINYDFGSYMEPITIDIKEGKLVNLKRYSYKAY